MYPLLYWVQNIKASMGNFNERILRLLQLYLLKTLSDLERQELEDWCAEREENRLFFKRVREDDLLSKELAVYRQLDKAEAKRKFKRRVGLIQRKGINLRVMKILPYAAIVVVGLFVAIVWQQHRLEQVTIPSSSQSIQPGCAQATLVLSEGQKVILKEEGNTPITVEPGMVATCENGRLVYTPSRVKDTNVLKFNELIIPRGGEYQLTLGDGSHVQMNSASTLKYPVMFNQQERRVYLTGEAFFEVAKDPVHPFIVNVGDMEIRVYGTSFNINTLKKDGVQTVLVEGSVGIKVLQSGEECMIKPGQLAEYNKEMGKMEIREVNTSLYTDWKEGIFRFENERLEDILETLSNWYNVDVFYQTSSVKELHFSGFMERYEQIGSILNAITISTGVHFDIREHTITVLK